MEEPIIKQPKVDTPSPVEEMSIPPSTTLPGYDSSIQPSRPPSKVRSMIYIGALLLFLSGGTYLGMANLGNSTEKRAKAGNTAPTLSMSPSTLNGNVGDVATIGITMNTHADTVAAGEFQFTYDPAAIQLIGFTHGKALPVVLVPFANTNSTASVTLGVQPTAPFKGSDIIGTFQVKILSARQSSLGFGNATKIASIGKDTNSLASAVGTTITGTGTGNVGLSPSNTPIPRISIRVPTERTTSERGKANVGSSPSNTPIPRISIRVPPKRTVSVTQAPRMILTGQNVQPAEPTSLLLAMPQDTITPEVAVQDVVSSEKNGFMKWLDSIQALFSKIFYSGS